MPLYYRGMKHYKFPQADAAPVTPSVIVLRCQSQLALNPEPLSVIFAEQGEDIAEETVCRALEDLARRLDQVQADRARARFDQMVTPLGRMAAIAEQIGLQEFAMAARHLADAAAQKDGIAVEATMGRLERAFDAAVSQVWHFKDLF